MKRVFALLLLTFTTLSAFSQKDSIYYYTKLGRIINSQTEAKRYDKVKNVIDTVIFLEKYINNRGQWLHEEDDKKLKRIDKYNFVIFSKVTSPTDTIYRKVTKVDPGYIVKDYQNNYLISIGYSRMIIPLIKEGTWRNYYTTTHTLKSEEEYKDNQMISNKRWKENGQEDISDVFTTSETDAFFPGGHDRLEQFLSNNIKYPKKSRRKGEEGTVTAQFVVMEDGTINGIEIIKGVSPLLDEESLRVLQSMPSWRPGITNNQTVRIALQVPIQYSLPKK